MNSNAADPPWAKRLGLGVEAEVKHSQGRAFRARIFNASAEGCKIELVERPEVGESVWVKFEGMEALEATVRWIAGHTYGVKFTSPLRGAVLKQLACAFGAE